MAEGQDGNDRGATGSTTLPLTDMARPWDGDVARGRVKTWASDADGKIDFAKYAKAFFWVDPEQSQIQGGYKLGFADVIDGELQAVPRGVMACAGAMMGVRGGVDIPAADEAGVKNKIATYYRKMGMTPPWEQEQSASVQDTRGLDPAVPRVRSADFAPVTYDREANTIDLVWTSGARVRRRGFVTEWDEELSLEPGAVRLDRLNTVGVMLAAHDGRKLESVIGRIVPGTARIEGGRGIATVRLSAEEVDRVVVNKIASGLIPAVSVGYTTYREAVFKGGGNGGVDLYRVTDWEPFEVSAVPMPADAQAMFRAAPESAPTRRNTEMADERKPTEAELEQARNEGAEKARAEAEGKAKEDARVLSKTERERASAIMSAARKLGVDESRAMEFVASDSTLDGVRAALIDLAAARDESSPTHPHHRIDVTSDEKEKRGAAMAEYLCHRGNPAGFKMPEGLAREYVGASLFDMARECLESSGVPTRGSPKMQVAERALRMRDPRRDELKVRGLLSTSDFPLILAAVTGKNLRRAYDESQRTFVGFTSQRVVPDFKTQRELLLSEAPDLETVNEAGEFKYGILREGQETWSVLTYGKIVGITRQAIVNDDLGAFTRIPSLLGAAAARKESDIVWAIVTANANMSDAIALFEANTHKNYTASGAGAPSVSEIAKGRTLMRKQTGPNGATLNLMPRFLIVPAALETTAEQLIATITPATTANAVPEAIRSLGLIVEPRLDANSATAWYLSAAPSQVDTLVYGYLEGNTGPYVETRDGFEIDGTEIKIRHDFGAGAVDYRGLYKSIGTA